MAITQTQPSHVQTLIQAQAEALPLSSSMQPAPQALPCLNQALLKQIKALDFSFVISDAQHPDMPIVYASDGFYSTTGYTSDEVIGRNCRFLQGPETERQKVMEIRDAIREDRCCQVCLVNYRKDGSTFLNQFFLSPMKNEEGIVTHYVGIQTDVSAAAAAGLLDAPEQMAEQQAAVALGTAAGCSMCDMVMQQREVQRQLQQQQQQQGQQQQQAAAQQPQQTQAQAARPSLESVPEVVQEEVVHALRIQNAFMQSPQAGACSLPSSLLQSLLKVQAAYVLSDPRQPDCPIVHASPEFLALTGYSREEVEGRNCRFLQGADTDKAEVARLRAAMSSSPPKAVTVTLLNYRKDGSPFWNALHVAPVRDAEGVLEYYIGVQLDVTQQQEQEHKLQDTPGLKEHSAAPCKLALRHKMAHMTATGAVRVACRGLSGCAGGLRRSMEDQALPHRGYATSLCKRASGASTPTGVSGASFGGSGSFGRAADAAVAEVAADAAVAATDGQQ